MHPIDEDTSHPLPADSNKLGRRALLGMAAALLPGAALAQTAGRTYGPGAPPIRYPEPDVVVLDDRFSTIKIGNAAR